MALELCNNRPIGGVGEPEWTDQTLPPLGRPGRLTVGVIDTGILLDHCGRPPSWFGQGHISCCPDDDADELVYPRGERLPSEGHGTFVAGLVLREAPTARVRMWGVLAKDRMPKNLNESTERDDQAVLAALAALAGNPAVQVVNLSFGDILERSVDPGTVKRLETFEAAVASFMTLRPDVAVVAAAGNGKTDEEFFPAAYEGVLAVGAVDETALEEDLKSRRQLIPEATLGADERPPPADFTNHGEWVDVYARGVDVLGPLPQVNGPGWAHWSGTSFAAAVVSGRIAQIAIERGVSGAVARDAMLHESLALEGGGVWVQGIDSIKAPPTTS